MQPTVFFYVQHLWGVGHVYRASRVARALARQGFDVHLIWGGTKLPGFDLPELDIRDLTPVRTSDVSFSQLLHADMEPFSQQDEAARAAQLLEWFDEINPDILITEAYPFGRRQMRFELLPLLEKAKTRKDAPLIVSSIRDIMQEGRKEKRVAESVSLVERYYDLVLVHGDEELIAISETLQGTEHFKDKIRYTGLVTPDPAEEPEPDLPPCNVLVTVGGGAFGQALTRTALDAMVHCRSFPSGWVVVAGTEMSENDYHSLMDMCPAGMKIVRHVRGLVNAMAKTKVSVSHAGYNTVADILRAGCRSVLYPYAEGNETEQSRRARIMEQRGLAVQLLPEMLSPTGMAEAIDRAAELRPTDYVFEVSGAENSAQILRAELQSLSRA